jgi:hypothetical protein
VPTPIEQDWDKAINPNGKRVEMKMPPLMKKMCKVFFYMGWSSGAGRIMAAGRSIDESTQMMKIMEIMDCIEQDERFLGVKKEGLVGPEADDLTTIQ